MITLELTHPVGLVMKSGRETFDVLGGKKLKIETSPEGVDILNAEVPEGKRWTVSLSLQISEVNM